MSGENEKPVEQLAGDPVDLPSPHAADWFWHPWYAKLLWALAALYWVGLYGLLLVPADRLNSYLANAMILLIFVLNPITVVAVLGLAS